MSRLYQYPEVTELQENDVMMIDREGNETAKSILASKVAPALMSKTITERGVYKASDDGVRGYNEVDVDIPYTDVHVATGAIATFEGEDLPLKSLTASIVPVQAGSGDPSPTNVRPISGWTEEVITVTDDLQNPTVTHTTTIPFTDGQGQSVTVYGGTLDVTSGVLTVDRVMVDLGTLNWQYSVADVRFYYNGLDYKRPPSGNVKANAICSEYPIVAFGSLADKTISLYSNGYMYAKDSNYNSATDFKTALNGVQLVYELATPTTFYTQPTAVKSLDGENNVSASTGDVDVEYQTVWVRPTE
jgi:hypothetical protein